MVEALEGHAEVGVVACQLGPSIKLADDGDAGAGDVGQGKRTVATGFPGGEGEGEGGYLDAARIYLEAEEVVAEDGVGGVVLGETLFLHAHTTEHFESGDKEVARAAAGVHDGDLGGAVGPAGERAGGGS